MMKKGSHLLVLFCFLCFLVSACGGGDSGDFGSSTPGPTPGPSPDPTPGPSPGPSGTEKWKTPIKDIRPAGVIDNPLFGILIVSSAAIATDGTIYVGSTDSRLYALKQDGTVKWRYETGDQIVASPAIGSDGTVYVGSADRQLYAINPNGTLKWVSPTKSVLSSSPALATDGTIYVAGTNLDKTIMCSPNPDQIPAAQLGELYAINPNGTMKWSRILSGSVNSSPVIASDGTIYIGSAGDINFDRINPCDKTTSFPPSDANPFYPVNGHIYAINPTDGSIKWDYKTSGSVDSSAAIATDGTIYIGSDYAKWAYGLDSDGLPIAIPIGSLATGFLYAINPNGTPIWSTDLFGNVKSSPAIGSDGTIYVGTDKEDVFAVNPAFGTIKWAFPTRGPARSSPALAADGTIYIGSNDSGLYALNPDGTLKSLFVADAAITSSPAITGDGTVYFATGEPGASAAFYAVNSSSGQAATVWTKFRRNLLNTGRQ